MSAVSGEPPVVLRAKDLVRHIPVTKGILLRRTVGQVKAVDGVSLEVRRGETLGLVGESGCGKSTLARLLTMIDRPTSGEITVMGERVDQLRGRRLRLARRHIKLVFQDPYTSLDPRMTVESIVREPLVIHRDFAPRGDHRAMVRELLELVGLNPDHSHRYPHQFSGGQRQRIGIARALALRPEVLVCDEPVSALDVSVQAQIINLFASLQRELGVAYLFIAHDLSVVEHIADRVAVMYLGKIVERGEADQVYLRPEHPYTHALLSAVPDPDAPASAQRIRLQGDVPSPVDPPSGCRFRTRCWLAEDRCAEQEPLLARPADGDHDVACHFPITHPVGDTDLGRQSQ
jgi:oligopeptide transport system ATP-binding protein